MRVWFVRTFITLTASFLLEGGNSAQAVEEFSAGQVAYFERHVRPLLAAKCYACHSEKAAKIKGGLRLDSRAGILKGGDSGKAAARPRSAKVSLLLQLVRYSENDQRMPPAPNRRLEKKEVSILARWIQMGLPFPNVSKPRPNLAANPEEGADWKNKYDWDEAAQFRFFRKPEKRKVPQVAEKSWPRSDIDRFLLAKLESEKLRPAPDASPRVLLRRLYFDLVGLPPMPKQAEGFLTAFDSDPEKAVEDLVDELLASPHFGERWGRHWMDVARYAESTGMERNFSYPHAWRYRDYVVASFNQDKPYDIFVKEQLAGDLLPSGGEETDQERLVATGFLAMGPKSLNERNEEQFGMDVVDEQIDVATRATLGLSVSCARCHDHKFDPIPTEDYYALAGIFRSTRTYYGTKGGNGNRQASALLPVGENAERRQAEVAAHDKKVASINRELKQAQKRLQNLKKAKPGQGVNAKMEECQADLKDMASRLKKLRQNRPLGPAFAMGVRDLPKPADCQVRLRGDVASLGPAIPRGYLTALPVPAAPRPAADQSGRLQFAEWLVHEENPLAARVMVNRIWSHLFGQGIVRTVDNFGASGEAPSHLELLDHLALRFIDNGWSVKKSIRQIVLSRAYRLSDEESKSAHLKDPENRLLHRANARRLEAEAMRDAMLLVSGSLDLTPARGSAVRKDGNIGRDVTVPQNAPGFVHRRSLYLPIVRNGLPEFLRLFDFAEPSMIVGRRQETTVPTQALFLLNSPFVIKQSRAMAEHLLAQDPGSAPEPLVKQAYLRALSRPPNERELAEALEFRQAALAGKGADAETEALAHLCHAIFAGAEFRYLH